MVDIQTRLDQRYEDAIANQQYPEEVLGTQRCVVMAYMDDCTISVPWVLAEDVCADLNEICSQYGLQLNVEKCRIIGPNTSHLPATAPFQLLPEGDIVLGNPVGTFEFRAATTRALIDKYIRILPTLDALQVNPIAAFNIIKFCVNARANYLARVQDLDGLDCLQAFDTAVDEAIFKIAQHNPTDATRRALSATLRSIPLSHGGLGVARYSWIPGQVGVIRSRQLLAEFIDEHLSPGYSHAVTSLPGIQIGEGHCPLPIDFGPLPARENMDDLEILNGEYSTTDAAPVQYKAIAATIVAFLNNVMKSPARAAWLRSSQFEGSGRWVTPLAAVYHDGLFSLNANEYRVSLRQRFLLAPFEDSMDHVHPTLCQCGVALNDKESPFHFLDCPLNKGFNHTRHAYCLTAVDGFLKKKLKERSIQTCSVPPPRLHNPEGEVLDQNGDLAVHLLPNVSQVFDFVVSNPAAATFTNNHHSHEMDNAANAFHETEKLRHYGHTREVQEEQLIPFAVEATGRMGPRAINWIETFIPQDERQGRRGISRTPVQSLHAILCTAITKCVALPMLYYIGDVKRGNDIWDCMPHLINSIVYVYIEGSACI